MTDELRDAFWEAIALTVLNEHPELRLVFSELGTVPAEESTRKFRAWSANLAVPSQTLELFRSPFWRN